MLRIADGDANVLNQRFDLVDVSRYRNPVDLAIPCETGPRPYVAYSQEVVLTELAPRIIGLINDERLYECLEWGVLHQAPKYGTLEGQIVDGFVIYTPTEKLKNTKVKSFTYSNPHPTVGFNMLLPEDEASFDSLEAQLTFGGIVGHVIHFDAGGLLPGDQFRLPLQIDTTSLPTVRDYLGRDAGHAVTFATRHTIATQPAGPTQFRMRSGWLTGTIPRSDNFDWFGIFRGHRFIYSAIVAVAPIEREGRITGYEYSMELVYTVFKEYNFERGEVFNFPLGVEVSGKPLSQLHAAGLARNYDI